MVKKKRIPFRWNETNWMNAIYEGGYQASSMRCIIGRAVYQSIPNPISEKEFADKFDFAQNQVRSEFLRVRRRTEREKKQYHFPFTMTDVGNGVWKYEFTDPYAEY
jgi:hypothetical protein